MAERADNAVANAQFSADSPFRILTVCTMNICRSPALEVCFEDNLKECSTLPAGAVHLSSAGTHATPGAPSCDISLAHVGRVSREETSRQLTGGILANADLVITAERKHAGFVSAQGTGFGTRCFPAKAAARLATWVVEDGSLAVGIRKANGEPVQADFENPESLTDPLPDDPVARLRWLVAQMDGSRGFAPRAGTSAHPSVEPDDIPDPHVLGYNLHEMSGQMVRAAVTELAAAAAVVLGVTRD